MTAIIGAGDSSFRYGLTIIQIRKTLIQLRFRLLTAGKLSSLVSMLFTLFNNKKESDKL
jgi:hypothetical protein